ncbi:MAG: spore coat protein U domain-containing protein [Pseudomonadota bacterium]
MMRKTLLMIVALLPLLLFAPQRAHAATTCSATMTDMSFGDVVPSGAAVNVTATITWTCTYTGLLSSLYGDYIQMCFSAGSGSASASLNPRKMIESGSSELMSYEMYRDAGRTSIWGTASAAQISGTSSFTILGSGTAKVGTTTVYGRVPTGQTSLGVGSYASVFGGTYNYAYNEALLGLGTYPNSTCGSSGGSTTGSGTGSLSFSVLANVASSCTAVSGTALDFGTKGLITSNADQTSTISLTCTKRSPYNVGLNAGSNASTAGDVNTRRMTDGSAHYIGYQMYSDTGRSTVWGNTVSSSTVNGTAVGGTQTFTVYGRVPPQAPRAGTYNDTVTVTVTY